MATDNHDHAHAHEHSAKMYIITFVVLAICTVATFLFAEMDLGRWSFVIAMAIACTKASFVVLFFMHLWDQPGPNRLTMAISLLFLATLITMTLADVATRFPLALPPGSHRSLHIGHPGSIP